MSKGQEERTRLAEDARLQREEDLRAVMATAAGRRFVWRLLDEVAGTLGPSFAGEAPLSTAFGEGRRAVGIAVMGDVQRVAPEQYVAMLMERLESQRKAAAERDSEKT